jgi:DNA-binding MarR family transcriptional regulator
LWERGTCTVKELAETLKLDHGTLTPLLRRMEAKGLLTRRRADVDERFVEVAVAPDGDALQVHAGRIHCDMKDALGMGDVEFTALQSTLRLLTANLTTSPLAVGVIRPV